MRHLFPLNVSAPEPRPGRDSPEEDGADGGFTLIELMVVVVILGLLVGIIGFRFLGRTEDARRTAAALQIKSFVSALRLYRLDNFVYPTTEQGLDALVQKPTTSPVPRNYSPGGYLDGSRVPLDPWGNPYVYQSPGPGSHEFLIKSFGADGQEGGEGENADVGSENLR